MNINLKGKVAVITGGTSGIGAACNKSVFRIRSFRLCVRCQTGSD